MTAEEYLAEIDRSYEHLRGEALEQRLLDLTKLCREEHGRESKVYISVINELGSYYRGQGRYLDAERCYNLALRLLEAMDEEAGEDYTTTLNNLAGAHRLLGKADEAEAEYGRCLERYRAALGEDSLFYAAALNNLSLLYLDRGDTEKASDCLTRSSEILSAMPECRDEYASSMCNLGALYIRRGQPELACEPLEEAAAMYREELGTDTPHYHAALNSLGVARWQTGNHAAAEEAFALGLASAEALYGQSHPESQRLRERLDTVRKKRREGP